MGSIASLNVYIFGAGKNGRRLLCYLGQKQVKGFIDNDARLYNKLVEGVPVYSLLDVLTLNDSSEIYVYISSKSAAEIELQLKKHGISKYEIWNQTNNISAIDEKLLQNQSLELHKKLELYNLKKSVTINKLFMAGINIDDYNYGCRATSGALLDILSEKYVIGDVVYRHDLLDMFDEVGSIKSVFEYICYTRLNRSDTWLRLEARLCQVDALVINGEGSFIFGEKIRKDLFVFCVLMIIAMENRIPFFVVNCMISGDGNDDIECDYCSEVMEILSHASGVAVRDMESYENIRKEICDVNIKYIPDALFSRFWSVNKDQHLRKTILENYSMFMPFVSKMRATNDITGQYVVVAGSSAAPYNREKAQRQFEKMIDSLRESLSKYDIKLVVMECCRGDNFLRNIIRESEIFVPVESNLEIVGMILQNAKCFISGRYHPSILASLGGTPCVFLGSNSHKTRSLQRVLDYERVKTYSALPSDEEIKEICSDVDKIIQDSEEMRKKISMKCEQNACISKDLIDFIL